MNPATFNDYLLRLENLQDILDSNPLNASANREFNQIVHTLEARVRSDCYLTI